MNHQVKSYMKIILGSIAVAVGIYFFWAPAQFAAGGISGLAIVLQSILTQVPISVLVFCLDILMFIIGFVVLGAGFGVKSITSSLSIALTMRIFEYVVPEVAMLSQDHLVILIFGALFIAFGQAIIFNQEASSGGTDIIAKIISKYTHINIATSLLIADMVVVLLAISQFGIEKGLYAALGVLITTTLIDYFISGFSVEKYVVIIPSEEKLIQPITAYILDKLERGATKYDAEGAYSNNRKTVITTVVDRRQFVMLKEYVSEVDENAFVTVQNLHEVMGEGFKVKS
ncbi:YitT family protein [Niameybacter massiliensis]|uniref:YitT family protein n=1 Tax=Holtiella tumoricola TaxID=3018743 RepID=A0AA42DRS6_9FIRM|nr:MULTISPECIES: YitT family protein [Lachnospirales]MDA3733828.1 YitT family protein [Holtiella tumoricola]